MCVFLIGRPKNTHIYNEKRSRGGMCVAMTDNSWLQEITRVVIENAIFVEDFRVPENPGGGGPVEASRVSPNRSVGERVL